ncbi:uncharacterized protein K452DRAFT_315320 [Aplosporella prunicola CBS 121167]|uniref:General transcription and DNA repair factor IIH n=1 Tax=Aplosporella prunicola CBS 121167 TaxID=1176127 RepID=A0A6A6BPZ7_9PEZI|nr:uncharacterized protein K452DRAFT_315320 [Aplosporella prunicola CBS 121167]KAF2146060.1 hypothetical protein K452DRAFT_315320 [Aplosporella prunicola CBS 121167]
MADSDGEYVLGSDDEPSATNASLGTRAKGKSANGARGKERWERGVQTDANTLREGADGTLVTDWEETLEAQKRKRLRQDTKPFQRGIIRHVVLVLDLSEAMLEKDFRPNRFLVTLKYAQEYVREFFEQNPISQMCVMGMHDGLCIRISELGGNPNDHIAPLQRLRNTRDLLHQEPKGSPSLQNALEQARAALYHTPSHGTREVIIVLGALLSLDPGDIHSTIRSCVKDHVRVSIIGMGGRLKICQEICSKTNGGDETVYGVAVDQMHFRDLLMATTTPPVIRQTATTTTAAANPASLLMMGFPSRVIEDAPTICACHGNLTRGGYLCSRCKAKVCSLPATCPSCQLTLILSTHLARSYHHLFPLRNWAEVTWDRARQVGSTECKSCLTPFPPVPSRKALAAAAATEASTQGKGALKRPERRVEGASASESSRYECESCRCHFCVDCDLFCHEVVHNCPGCLSQATQEGDGGGGAAVEGAGNGKADGVVAANGAAGGPDRMVE